MCAAFVCQALGESAMRPDPTPRTVATGLGRGQKQNLTEWTETTVRPLTANVRSVFVQSVFVRVPN